MRSAPRQEILGLPWITYGSRGATTDPVFLGSHSSGKPRRRHCGQPLGLSASPRRGLRLVDAPGEAAFYGPKLDLQVRDGRRHEESIATVQLDFNQLSCST